MHGGNPENGSWKPLNRIIVDPSRWCKPHLHHIYPNTSSGFWAWLLSPPIWRPKRPKVFPRPWTFPSPACTQTCMTAKQQIAAKCKTTVRDQHSLWILTNISESFSPPADKFTFLGGGGWQRHYAVAKTPFATITRLSRGTHKHWHFWYERFIKYKNIYSCNLIEVWKKQINVLYYKITGSWKLVVAPEHASLLDATGVDKQISPGIAFMHLFVSTSLGFCSCGCDKGESHATFAGYIHCD